MFGKIKNEYIFMLYLNCSNTTTMATVKFRIRSNADKNVSIKVILSMGRENFLELKTGFSINPKNWNSKIGFPNNNVTENKRIFNALKKLELSIFENLNTDLENEVLINTTWLENIIKNCFNRIEKTDNNLLSKHTQYIIDNASTKKFTIGGVTKIGLSDSTIKNYKIFKNKIIEYEKHLTKQIRFLDITELFIVEFITWLFKNCEHSDNYAGRIVDTVKTVCKDADKSGIKTTQCSREIKSFRKPDSDRLLQILSFSELEILRELDFTDEEKLKLFKKENPKLTKDIELTTKTLTDARNWILIGCTIGQRGNDLLNVSKNKLRNKIDEIYVDVIQQKTGKAVTIGVNDSHILNILNNNFPQRFNDTRLNNLSKIVCKMAGFSQIVEGDKAVQIIAKDKKGVIIKDKNGNDKKINRVKRGSYPKYELITSHCFRRSFASNWYKRVPTPILMKITGHSKESLFLIYINKQEDKDANADLFMKYTREINKNNENEN